MQIANWGRCEANIVHYPPTIALFIAIYQSSLTRSYCLSLVIEFQVNIAIVQIHKMLFFLLLWAIQTDSSLSLSLLLDIKTLTESALAFISSERMWGWGAVFMFPEVRLCVGTVLCVLLLHVLSSQLDENILHKFEVSHVVKTNSTHG